MTTRHLRGGAERNIAHFVAWELANGYEVHVAVGRDSDLAALPSGAQVRRVGSLVRDVDPIRDWLAWRELRRMAAAGGYDMVHTHLSKAGVLGRIGARKRARRIVHTVHMASFGPGYGSIQNRLFRAAERYCGRFTDELVFVGRGLQDRYREAAVRSAGGMTIIHSPIEIDRFLEIRKWDRDARAAVRTSYGISQDTTLVLAIGSLERRKRHDLLMGALTPQLLDGKLSLLIAGDGAQRPRLERLAHEAGITGQVHLVGHVRHVAPLLAAADLLALTSTVEGVPQVVLQALAAGVPVVAAEVPGLNEIPDAPITVVPGDGAGLAGAIRDRLANPGSPVDPAAFLPWACPEIDRTIADFHARNLG